MPPNPYESPQQSAALSQTEFRWLPRPFLAAWLLAFLLPAVEIAAITLTESQIPIPIQWALFWSVPLVALLGCWTIVLTSPLAGPWKACWIAFTLLAMLLEIVAACVVCGIVGMALYGLGGTQ